MPLESPCRLPRSLASASPSVLRGGVSLSNLIQRLLSCEATTYSDDLVDDRPGTTNTFVAVLNIYHGTLHVARTYSSPFDRRVDR